MLYLVTYELEPAYRRRMGPVHEKLEETITSLADAWWHYISNTWIIETNRTVNQITNSISRHLTDEEDSLLVVAIRTPYEGLLPEDAWDWLNDAMRR